MVLRSLRRSGDELAIELDRPAGPYYPGDEVRVSITYEPRQDVSVREMRASFAAWEAYLSDDSDGNTSRRMLADQVVAQEVLAAGQTVAAGEALAFTASWQVPLDAMPPYAANALRCGWSVRVSVDIERGRDANESVALPVVVPAPMECVEVGVCGHASHPDKAEMRLCIPALELVEGETITGKLTVMPHESFGASHVQLALVRHQDVHAPRLKATGTQSIAKAKIEGKTRFSAGQAVEFPFSLAVPALGCPSRRTEHTTVTHNLEAVLGRGLRKNYEVGAQVTVYAGRRV